MRKLDLKDPCYFPELCIIIESLAELDLNSKLIQHSARVQHILLRPSSVTCYCNMYISTGMSGNICLISKTESYKAKRELLMDLQTSIR